MDIEPLNHTKPIPSDYPEYKRIANLMQGEYLIQISKMFSIHNPNIYSQYIETYNDYKLFYNNKKIQILELFHCTHVDYVQSIIDNNFDWRLVHRAKYGHGVSFSPIASYANLHGSLGASAVYGEDKNKKKCALKAMFVVDVIVGRKDVGYYFDLPDWNIDTTVSEDESVYVKYEDHEFYPKYVVYYISHPVVSEYGQRFLDKQ